MFHLYQIPFTANTEPLGYDVPVHGFGMTPNIPARAARAGSRWPAPTRPTSRCWTSGYFTDPDGYDERTIVDGLRIARQVAATEPFRRGSPGRSRPGPRCRPTRNCRRTAGPPTTPSTTRPAPAGWAPPTTRPPSSTRQLRLRGTTNVRIADASVFPTMTSVNPVVTVLMIGERAADLLCTT
jgi:choline dehydrogenase-like flavoprotein